jgi:phage tail-like protein
MDNRRLTSYYFIVELDGIETVSFTECTGLAAEVTVYEVEEGGYNTSTHKFIGHNKYPNLILRKGISKRNLLHEWCKSWFNQGDNDKVERKTISVVLYNSARKEMFRWNLFSCFPCRWKVEALDVKDNSYAIEMLEIAYEDMAVDETEEMPTNPFHIGQDMSGGQFTETMQATVQYTWRRTWVRVEYNDNNFNIRPFNERLHTVVNRRNTEWTSPIRFESRDKAFAAAREEAYAEQRRRRESRQGSNVAVRGGRIELTMNPMEHPVRGGTPGTQIVIEEIMIYEVFQIRN